jgi:hypothetical protein
VKVKHSIFDDDDDDDLFGSGKKKEPKKAASDLGFDDVDDDDDALFGPRKPNANKLSMSTTSVLVKKGLGGLFDDDDDDDDDNGLFGGQPTKAVAYSPKADVKPAPKAEIGDKSNDITTASFHPVLVPGAAQTKRESTPREPSAAKAESGIFGDDDDDLFGSHTLAPTKEVVSAPKPITKQTGGRLYASGYDDNLHDVATPAPKKEIAKPMVVAVAAAAPADLDGSEMFEKKEGDMEQQTEEPADAELTANTAGKISELAGKVGDFSPAMLMGEPPPSRRSSSYEEEADMDVESEGYTLLTTSARPKMAGKKKRPTKKSFNAVETAATIAHSTTEKSPLIAMPTTTTATAIIATATTSTTTATSAVTTDTTIDNASAKKVASIATPAVEVGDGDILFGAPAVLVSAPATVAEEDMFQSESHTTAVEAWGTDAAATSEAEAAAVAAPATVAEEDMFQSESHTTTVEARGNDAAATSEAEAATVAASENEAADARALENADAIAAKPTAAAGKDGAAEVNAAGEGNVVKKAEASVAADPFGDNDDWYRNTFSPNLANAAKIEGKAVAKLASTTLFDDDDDLFGSAPAPALKQGMMKPNTSLVAKAGGKPTALGEGGLFDDGPDDDIFGAFKVVIKKVQPVKTAPIKVRTGIVCVCVYTFI